MRDSQIYISHDLKHVLYLVVKAQNNGGSDMDSKQTVDGLADELLTEAIQTKWPGVITYLTKRRQAEAEVVKQLSQPQ